MVIVETCIGLRNWWFLH